MKKILTSLIASCILSTALAKDIVIREGVDYTLTPSVSKALPQKPGKVNVTEFYSYACIHCSILEPALDQWYASSTNVELDRIQVVWENNFTNYAKINATAQMLNLGSAFNQKVFNATMSEHKNLEDPAQLQSFLTANKTSLDPKKFMATYNSFAVSTKPQEYAQFAQAYNITGTPTFVVANKYMTKPAQPAKLIQVLQALVNKVKKEQKIR